MNDAHAPDPTNCCALRPSAISRLTTWLLALLITKGFEEFLRDSAQESVEVSAEPLVAEDSDADPELQYTSGWSRHARSRAHAPGAESLGSRSPKPWTNSRPSIDPVIQWRLAKYCSSPKIATITGSPVNTVKTRSVHARKRLADILRRKRLAKCFRRIERDGACNAQPESEKAGGNGARRRTEALALVRHPERGGRPASRATRCPGAALNPSSSDAVGLRKASNRRTRKPGLSLSCISSTQRRCKSTGPGQDVRQCQRGGARGCESRPLDALQWAFAVQGALVLVTANHVLDHSHPTGPRVGFLDPPRVSRPMVRNCAFRLPEDVSGGTRCRVYHRTMRGPSPTG